MKPIRILAFISCFLFHSILFSQPNPLRLEISLIKNDYLRCEPIYLHFNLINNANLMVRSHSIILENDYLHFLIQNEKGAIFPLRWIEREYRDTSMSNKIAPHDTIQRTIPLLFFYGNSSVVPTPSSGETYLPVGVYTIQASLETALGSISSQKRTFTIAEPDGKELEAYQLFIDASRNHKMEIFDKLIDLYPHSVYSIEAMRWKVKVYVAMDKEEDQEKLFNTAVMLVEQYPAHESTTDALRALINMKETFKTRKEKIELFKKIAEKHPNTEVGKSIMHLLADKKWKLPE
jgi:TolA-binding protein